MLDHDAYQRSFAEVLKAAGLPHGAIVRTGPLPQADVPVLYRVADALVFASVKEGFGLVVLEAMASGLPVVTSRMAPFTEYLSEEDAAWCDPFDAQSIARAMARAIGAPRRQSLIAKGAVVAARHNWRAVASAHLLVYEQLCEVEHA